MAARMQPLKKRLSAISDDGQLAGGDGSGNGDDTSMLHLHHQQQLTPGNHEGGEALPYAYLPVALGRKRKKTSWVWNHFVFGVGENERNVCKHCLLVSPNDATSYPRSTGNSTLAVHLHTKHGIVRETGGGGATSSPGTPATPVTPATPATPATPFTVGSANAGVVAAAAAATGIANAASHGFKTPPTKAESYNHPLKQLKQQQQQQQHRAVDARHQAEIEDALANFLIDEQLSYDVLERASFVAFAKKLNPYFQPPTRDALVASIDKQFTQALQKISFVVQEIPGGVALTLDRWSTPGYVGVTLHWVSSDWELKKCLLELKHSPPQFDAWAITELVLAALREHNLSTKVRAITTDMGSELEPAVAQVRQVLQSEFVVQVSDAWHLRCVSHILQHCVSAALEKIAAPLASLRTVVKLLHDSDSLQKAYKLFQQQQQKATGKGTVVEKIPVLDVENKWETLFAMIDAAYEVKDVFDVLFASNASSGLRNQCQQQLRFSDADWRTLKCVKDFLEQAAGYTVVSEDDYISASLLPLIYDSLQAHCKNTIDGRAGASVGITPLAKSAASAFLDVLQSNKRHLWNHFANLAQILDPRVANASVEAVAMKAEIRRILIDEYDLNVQESSYTSATTTASSSTSATATSEITTPVKAEKQISSLFAAARQARNETHPERVTEDEVDAFFKFTANADLGCEDVLEWWRVVGATRFPKMGLLARDTLMIMGSALPASAFTGSDHLVSRARATANDAELQMARKVRAWNLFVRDGASV